MKTILGERGQVKVTIDERIMEDFGLYEDKLGKKTTYRIARKDKEKFQVNIEGVGHVMSLSSFMYEDIHGGFLMFWANKQICFKTDYLFNKTVHISLDNNEINIKIENDEKQGME